MGPAFAESRLILGIILIAIIGSGYDLRLRYNCGRQMTYKESKPLTFIPCCRTIAQLLSNITNACMPRKRVMKAGYLERKKDGVRTETCIDARTQAMHSYQPKENRTRGKKVSLPDIPFHRRFEIRRHDTVMSSS